MAHDRRSRPRRAGRAWLIGAVVNRYEAWFRGGVAALPRMMGASPELDQPVCHAPADAARPATARFLNAGWTTFRRIAPYVLLGLLAAALITALLPEDAIPRLIGGANGPTAYLLAAVAGIPLYVCQGEEVPLTYAVLATGVAPGPALTFLLGSVGSCIPTIIISRSVLSGRVTAFYVTFWLTFAVAAGIAFQATLGG